MLETREERKDFLEYTFYLITLAMFIGMMGYSIGWINIAKAFVGVLGFGAIGALLGKWVKRGKH